MEKVIAVILIILGASMFFAVYLAGKKYKEDYEEELGYLEDEIQFREQKKKKKKKDDFFPALASFFLKMFDVMNYRNTSFVERRIEMQFIKLYDQDHRKYFRVAMAKTYGMAILIISFGLVFTGLYTISNIQESNVQIVDGKIIRPDVGKGPEVLPLEIQFKGKENEVKKEIELNVGEARYSEEDTISKLEKGLKESLILGNNEDSQAVASRLNLIKNFKGFDTKKFAILWESSNMNIIDEKGNVNRELVDLENGEIDLKAVLVRKEDNKVLWTRDFSMNVLKNGPPTNEQLVKKAVSSFGDSMNFGADKIEIPKNIHGVEVSWKVKKEKNITIYLVIGFMVIGIALALVRVKESTIKNIKNKREHILYEFPEFLNKLILLVNAGMNIRDAWLKISDDVKKNNYFFRLVKETAYDIREAGTTELEAYDRFKKKCSISQTSKFTNIIRQNLRKGSSEMVYRLEELSKTCWQMRVDVTKEMGKRASSKLLFPMLIMLIVIIIIVGMPAVIQISS